VLFPHFSLDAYACGPDCRFYLENDICFEDCSEGIEHNEENGVCEWAGGCDERAPNYLLTNDICGEGCVVINETDCDDECESFYEENERSKICELLPCELRTPNLESQLSCGELPCYLFGDTCVSECRKDYEIGSGNECIEVKMEKKSDMLLFIIIVAVGGVIILLTVIVVLILTLKTSKVRRKKTMLSTIQEDYQV
jgi:hypothetical protein